MRAKQTFAAIATALVVGLALPGYAAAQDPVPPAPEPPVETQVEVTDELLERFVTVYPAVVNVARAAQNQMATAETAEEAQEIQVEAQTRVASLLEEGDLTPVEYEAVVRELNADPELMAEFEQRLEEAMEEGDGTI